MLLRPPLDQQVLPEDDPGAPGVASGAALRLASREAVVEPVELLGGEVRGAAGPAARRPLARMATRSATPSPPPKLWVATTAAPPAALKASRNSFEPLAPALVEPGEGLVEEQQPGLAQEHAGQPEPPLHARRERAHALVRHAVELHLGERGVEPRGRGSPPRMVSQKRRFSRAVRSS